MDVFGRGVSFDPAKDAVVRNEATRLRAALVLYTPFCAAYAGTKAPVEHFTRAASKEFGDRGISVTAIGPGAMDTPSFYPAEGADAQAYHKATAALSKFTMRGLTDIEDIVPFIRFLLMDDRPDHSRQRRLHYPVSHRAAGGPWRTSAAFRGRDGML